MRRSLFFAALITAFVIGTVGSVFAYSNYLSAFNSKYSKSWDCGVCHYDTVNGGGTRNAYGNDFRSISTHSSDPSGALDAIASMPSPCSGNTYLDMINQGLYPGGHGSSVSCPTPAPVTCNSFTYGQWGACQPDGTQSRSIATSSPSGCTGGNPVTTQTCTYTQPCTSYTYTLGACQPDNTAPVTSYMGIPSGCSGGATPAATQPCTYSAPTCNSFTYGQWGPCQPDGTQSRSIATSSPSGCTGGSPVTTQSCNYGAPTCDSFTYSDWDVCQPDGTQSRTVMSSSPGGCTGGNPVISQTCTYVPPPTEGVMPIPTGRQTFTYKAVAAPVLSTDPSQAEPIGVGAVATGGKTFDITIGLDQFAAPVDVSFAIYASSIDPRHVYYFGSDYSPRTSYAVWRTTVRGLSDALALNVPVSALPAGQYILILQVRPSGSSGDDEDNSGYYRWVTSFGIQSSDTDHRSGDDGRSDGSGRSDD